MIRTIDHNVSADIEKQREEAVFVLFYAFSPCWKQRCKPLISCRILRADSHGNGKSMVPTSVNLKLLTKTAKANSLSGIERLPILGGH